MSWTDYAAMAFGPTGAFVSGAKGAFGMLGRGTTPQQGNYTYNYTPKFDWAQAQKDYAAQQAAQQGLMGAADEAALQAAGKTGPSLAELQMRGAQNDVALQAAQQAASARGGPAAQAAAQRQAQATAATTGAAVAQAAGIQRLQEQEAARARRLAALQAAGGMAGQMRQGSQGQEEARIGAEMQAARFDQEGRMGYDAAATAADQAYRKRKLDFYGKFIDQGAAVGTKAATGGLG